MKFQRRQLVAAMAGLMLVLSAGAASAMGGPSGAAVGMPAQGHIGEVIVNPYKIAPLTAIVRTGGYVVKNASVRVVPKKGGREIAYKVSDRQIRTHAGIPIAGLYADYLNTVEVSYTRVLPTARARTSRIVCSSMHPPFSQSATACLGSSGCSTLK